MFVTANMLPAKLILANGREFNGYSPKWQNQLYTGETVFNTGMTGYEETLTDPSYSGQILTFTYPILGNYGVSTGELWESKRIHVSGVICETLYNDAIHHASVKNFLTWLEENQTPIICGVDTRELTKEIRSHGVISGAIVCNDNVADIDFSDTMNIDWVAKISNPEIQTFGNGKYKIILVDCGAKENILRCLLKFDVTVKRVPFDYDYTQEDFDGVMLSNGPGDPKMCKKTIRILQKALKLNKPIFGICLGSQLMGLAIGADTYKLKFGHRGQNQPCISLDNGLCYLTSQNHGYAVDEATLPAGWAVSFKHLNDSTIAGIRHEKLPLSAVQFHPEASAGPHDTFYLFEDFFSSIAKGGLIK